MKKAGYGVLGMGLAGAVIAHDLLARGCSVAFADEHTPAAASPIAPGLVNPLAGRKLKPDPLLPEWMSALHAARAVWEATYGEIFWHPLPIVRILDSPTQADRLEAVASDPDLRQWVGQTLPPGSHGPLIGDEYGSFLTAGSGWFDIPRFVQAVQSDPRLRRVSPDELPRHADRLVDCRGWRSSVSARWQHLPWNCARGEMMTVELAADLPLRIWNRGSWLRPLGTRRWQVGATYAWDAKTFADPPNNKSVEELKTRLAGWLRAPFKVIGQSAGVRAVVRDYRPVIGQHPEDPRWYLFSGLGSKGTLLAPAYGKALVDFLEDGAPLPCEASLSRFTRPPASS